LHNDIEFYPAMRFKKYIQGENPIGLKEDYLTRYCYGWGRYCMSQNLDSKFPLEFLDEGIRQTCLWNDVGLPFNLGGGPGASPKEAWFEYAELWKTECLQNLHGKISIRSGSKDFSANECSKKIAKIMKIDWDQLQNCVKGSFRDQIVPEVSQV
jgi:hypothetical protein